MPSQQQPQQPQQQQQQPQQQQADQRDNDAEDFAYSELHLMRRPNLQARFPWYRNSASTADMQHIDQEEALDFDEAFVMPDDLRPSKHKKRYLRALQLAATPTASEIDVQLDHSTGRCFGIVGPDGQLSPLNGNGKGRIGRDATIQQTKNPSSLMHSSTQDAGCLAHSHADSPSSRRPSPLSSSRSPHLAIRNAAEPSSVDDSVLMPTLALGAITKQSQQKPNHSSGKPPGALQRCATSTALLPSPKFVQPSEAKVDDVLRDPKRLESLYFGKNAKHAFFGQYRNLYSRPYLFMEDLEAKNDGGGETCEQDQDQDFAMTPSSASSGCLTSCRDQSVSSCAIAPTSIPRKASTATIPRGRRFNSTFAPMQQLAQTTCAPSSFQTGKDNSEQGASCQERMPSPEQSTPPNQDFVRQELLVTPPIPQMSPRTAFLTMCVSRNALALPFFIRKSFDAATLKVFDFSYQSLGDEVITEFANLLCQMTQVEQISVRDNRLSDQGLHFLLDRIVQLTQGIYPDRLSMSMIANAMPSRLSLRLLDVSQNEIGPKSARTLRTYVALGANEGSRTRLTMTSGGQGGTGTNSTISTARSGVQTMALPSSSISFCCTLRELIVENADIDDWECRSFMAALGKNKSVRKLVMSRNLIGKAENLNVVKPDFVTGGEAIAQMLQSNYHLLHLDLSWNHLRLESAHALAKSIELNSTLTELILAYNTCGDDGALKFGQFLRSNTSLHVLDLSYNSIGWKGAMTLASSLRSNQTLRKLLLNGNRIGREGGRMLFYCLTQNQNPDGLRLEMSGCDLSVAATATLRSVPTTRTLPAISGTTTSSSLTSTTESPSDAKANLKSTSFVFEPVYSSLQPSLHFFNPKEPTGKYILDLADPFDHMMAEELARLATIRKGCRFVKVDYRAKQPVNGKSKVKMTGKDSSSLVSAGFGPKKPLNLVRKTPPPRQAMTPVTSDEASAILKSFMSGLTIEEDSKGGIDKQQLMHVLNAIGLFPTFANLDQLVDVLQKYRRQEQEKETTHEEGTERTDRSSSRAESTCATARDDILNGEIEPLKSSNTSDDRIPAKSEFESSDTIDSSEEKSIKKVDYRVIQEQEIQACEQQDGPKVDPTENLSQLLFEAAFNWLDRDHSGNIDANEIEQAFKLLGLANVSEQEIHAVIGKYDVTGGGTLECHEFVDFLKDRLAQQAAVNQWQAAPGSSGYNPIRARLGSVNGLAPGENFRELLKAAQAKPLPELIDSSTGRQWIIPDHGCLEIEFLLERESSVTLEDCHFQWISDFGLKQLISNLTFASESSTKQSEQQELFRVALEDSEIFVSASQAWQLFDAYDHQAHRAKWVRLETIAMLLPQLLTPQDAQLFVSRVMTSFEEKIELKGFIGTSFAAFLGNPTTHYELDLSKPKDRVALCKISEIAHFEKTFSRDKSQRSDTSQHGNWENFRNETLDGRKVYLTTTFFVALPSQGKLCFDYVSTTRPRKGTLAMSQRRFDQVLREMDQEYRLYVRVLIQQKHQEAAAEVSTTRASSTTTTTEAVKEERDIVSVDLTSALRRVASSKVSSWEQLGSLEVQSEGSNNQTTATRASALERGSSSKQVASSATSTTSPATPGIKRRGSRKSIQLTATTTEHPEQLDPPQDQQHKEQNEWQYASDQLEFPDALALLNTLMSGINSIANGQRLSTTSNQLKPESIKGNDQEQKIREEINLKLALLETYFSDKFIDVSQARRLLQWFPRDLLGQASCARLLFARIVDLHLFYTLYDELDRDNQLALVKWLGYLNMMNPIVPERMYELDLSIHDEREMTKVLVELAVQEPGENWKNQSFRYSLAEPCIPGWQLPARWAKPESAKERDTGVSHSGLVTLEYYTGADQGCEPIWSLRKQLIKRVLCGTKLFL